MGNLFSCIKDNEKELLPRNRCPYCNIVFLTKKDYERHHNNCTPIYGDL